MATISLVMIVKDEEDVLEKCIQSVEPIIDEFIIVDTGSTDGTKDIIKKYGLLYEDEWISDVINKQMAMKRATSDYMIIMDADEIIISNLQRLKNYADNGVDGVSCRIEEGDPVHNTYHRMRLWTNSEDWVYDGPGMHGCISSTKPKRTIYDKKIKVKHAHVAKRKLTDNYYDDIQNEYIEKISKHLEKNPDDKRGWFYLSRTYKDHSEYYKAIWSYKKYLSFKDNYFIEERWQAMMDMASLHRIYGEYEKAISCYEMASNEDSRRAEHYVEKGIMYYNMSVWDKAIESFEESLKIPFPEDTTLFINPRNYHIIPNDYLSVCYSKSKKYDKALNSSLMILNSIEEDDPVHDRIKRNCEWYSDKNKLTILMSLGNTAEPIYGGILKDRGVHGIETTYIELSEELSKLGHDVSLFVKCDVEHMYNGVMYVPIENFISHCNSKKKIDVLISTRDVSVFNIDSECKKILWVQDCFPKCLDQPGVFDKIDLCVCSSGWHKNLMYQRLGHDLKEIKIIPLGIRKNLYNKPWINKIKNKAIYSSSPDRGLEELIDMWEDISNKVPDITLSICYGLESMEACIKSSEPEFFAEFKHDLFKKIQKFKNIKFTGRLTKKELAEEMLSSEICLYPVNFYETYCITAIECQAAGVPLITSPIAAMRNTVNPCCNALIDGHVSDIDYRDKFIYEVEHLLINDRELLKSMSNKCSEEILTSELGWKNIASLWQQNIWNLF